MSVKTETTHAGEFLVSEAPGSRSREEVTILTDEVVAAGDVLTTLTGTAAAAARAGNTGNGVLTMDATTPVLTGAREGVYTAVCVEPGANVGTFEVFGPDGVSLGRHIVAGAAFANEIKFAIADGATDFAVGDAFEITISALKYGLITTAGAARGIAWDKVDATGADKTGVAIVRDAEVNKEEVGFSTLNAGQKATAVAELKKLGIILREAI